VQVSSVQGNEDWYAETYNDLRHLPNVNEADVADNLVRPVLERVLGFSALEIRPQVTGSGDRPDFLCRWDNHTGAAAIVEVKRLGTNLTRRLAGQGWRTAPLGQLQRYLNNGTLARNGTWGILTNGEDWILQQRGRNPVSPFAFVSEQRAVTLLQVQQLLSQVVLSPAGPAQSLPDRSWLEQARGCQEARDFVVGLGRPVKELPNYRGALVTVRSHSREGRLFPTPAHLACLRLDYPDSRLETQDISSEIDSFQAVDYRDRIAGIALTAADHNRRCRGFLRVDGRLYATALVDPSQPSPRAVHQFEQIQEHWADADPQKAISALSSSKLQQRFHDEIGEWFSKTSSKRKELRHLIRVLFVWLLQKRRIVPEDALWGVGICPAAEDQCAVHRHIEWLFHDLLAVPKQDRSKDLPLIDIVGDEPWRDVLIETVPYLNGSLFTRLDEAERPEDLSNEMYLGEDGLLSILSRYDWTLSDRTGYASESAIDPAMLGDLFERLVLITDGVQTRGSHSSMPGGTYYTPQDIADEMTSDALAGWLAPKIGAGGG
jgi:hypothetical protein